MELNALLAPISEPSPCGENMSFSTEFDQITEMRRQDDATLDQGEWIASLKVADWPGVAASCSKLLSERTKDLRLAMWLTESWALMHGYVGLDKGLRLCTQLCEQYWPCLHPQPDNGDVEERIGNIGWLLQRVAILATALPVTQGRQGAAYSLSDLARARALQTAMARQADEAASLAAGKLTVDQFQRALKDTPTQRLLDTLATVHQSVQHLITWQAIVDGHLGTDGPSFAQAKEALTQASHDIERLARDVGALKKPLQSVSTDAHWAHDHSKAADAAAAMQPHHAGPLRTRAQALQQLQDVATFFRRTEPHSPVAYLAEKAVKWGDMPLHEWLRQVVKDQGAMSHLHELLGLDSADPGDAAH